MTPFEQAFEQVKQLAEKFHNNISFYSSPTYQEAEARKDFIDKFFIALGWDVNHDIQHNPYEQEVKVEKGQKQQQATAQKRADYAFYTAPNFKDVKFFVEAKKPSVGLRSEDHYFQTIRYGWNANTPIAILTDFEEFHIIDCRYKPDLRFVFNGKHKEYRYTDYSDKEKFAEIYWLFSREAVLENSLKKFADSLPKIKGKKATAGVKDLAAAIDDSFLAYIDNIREELAKAFKKNDESLGSEALTEVVTRTVDRLVFIRFLEDKLIEPNNHVSEWRSWNDFTTDCRKLDVKYNGVVFKEHPMLDKKGFAGAEEKMFLDICKDISNRNSPYDFNYIPIHILGSIYEQFLGKVVVATEHRVRIEEKPEVRKAGGVYYTPKYIVDYIVKNTVWECIKDKTPKEIATLRFADIACGSGSFLIGVYDYLLDYHKKYYLKKYADRTDALSKNNEDYGNIEFKDGQWSLTLKLKQDILLNNIYGVDIDRQAVEVTQLSLFLKMLEDETLSSTQVRQGALFSKVLPDLSKNIICGNSLIGTDILIGQLFSFEEEKKLNPMDYETSFPSIIKNGGFDVIVGNPPYGALFEEHSKNYLKNKYETFTWRGESYIVFIERAIQYLKLKGRFGMIVPDTYLNLEFTKPLRAYLLTKSKLEEILLLPSNVFAGATVDTTILLTSKSSSDDGIINSDVRIKTFDKKTITSNLEEPSKKFTINTKLWSNANSFNVQSDEKETVFISKIESNLKSLSEYSQIYYGIKAYQVGKGKPAQTEKIRDEKPFTSFEKKGNEWLPFYDGKHISRYEILWRNNNWINYGSWLAETRTPKVFENEKILIRKIVGKTLISTYVADTSYCNTLLFVLKLNEPLKFSYLYLLGILNSNFIGWYFRKKFQIASDDTFPQIMIRDILLFPIPISAKPIHDQLEALVKQMLDTKEQIATAQTEGDKNFLENKCNGLDRQIDNLVYKLYGLTEEEIKIVEGN